MKIYFAGSIRGGREDAALYGQIIEGLRAFGEVLTEHVGGPGLSPAGEAGLTDREIYERDMAWLVSSDLVVAEVSTPSLGVGFEIAAAVGRNIPVICLFREIPGRKLSAMIAGCPEIRAYRYNSVDEALNRVWECFHTG